MKRPADAKHDAFLARVGLRISRARRRAGLTQEQLAELLEVIPRVIQKIESGRTNPTLRTIARIADALSVDPRALVAARRPARRRGPRSAATASPTAKRKPARAKRSPTKA